jgi:hypothetical protein
MILDIGSHCQLQEAGDRAETLLTRIREVLGSNIGRDTAYLESGLPWFSSVHPGKCRDVASSKPGPLASKFIPIQSVTLPFHTILCGYWRRPEMNHKEGWNLAEASIMTNNGTNSWWPSNNQALSIESHGGEVEGNTGGKGCGYELLRPAL